MGVCNPMQPPSKYWFSSWPPTTAGPVQAGVGHTNGLENTGCDSQVGESWWEPNFVELPESVLKTIHNKVKHGRISFEKHLIIKLNFLQGGGEIKPDRSKREQFFAEKKNFWYFLFLLLLPRQRTRRSSICVATALMRRGRPAG